MRPSLRIATLTVVFAVSYFAVRYLEAGYKASMIPPASPLADLPFELGRWKGVDVPINEEVDRVVDAHSSVNRVYETGNSKSISLHVAAFTDPIYRASAPHHPETCYTAAGWELIERDVFKFNDGSINVPVGLTVFRRRGEQLVTAHWYNVGEVVFTGSEGMQSHFSKFWGSDSCPCIRKHLIQVPVAKIDDAKLVLDQFIPELVRELHKLE